MRGEMSIQEDSASSTFFSDLREVVGAGSVSVSCLHPLRNGGGLGTFYIAVPLGIAQVPSEAKQETMCMKGTMHTWEWWDLWTLHTPL